MMSRIFILVVLALAFWTSPYVKAVEQGLLQSEDIHKVMDEIFEQHVDKKTMTPDILQHALRIYIENFDPNKFYLLEGEVDRYWNLQPAELRKVLADYKAGNYTIFEDLQGTIQNSITRSRANRAALGKADINFGNLNKNQLKALDAFYRKISRAKYAKSNEELRERQRFQLLRYIEEQKKKYGDAQIRKNTGKVMAMYSDYLKEVEDEYLYVNADGTPMTAEEKQNLLYLHILKALASSLDSHTVFFNNHEAYDMRVRLEKGFTGIGVILRNAKDGVYVDYVIEGGPADKSGQVMLNDRIVEINGETASNMSYDKIKHMLQGNGTAVTLLLKRKVLETGMKAANLITVKLKPESVVFNNDRVDISFVPYEDGIIGKITLHSFYQSENGITSESDMIDALKRLKDHGKLKGLVFDMRNNAGGFLNQAVKVAGLFITNGVVVVSKYSNGDEKFYRDTDGKTFYDGPLVILTSKTTASAAEIVAQALQDYGVGLVVGDEQTYGKGTIQSQTVTDDKGYSYFKVTVGKYYTASGDTPQLKGVRSDILVPGPLNQQKIGEEYLEYTLNTDKIPASFKDDLSDIDPGLRPWYMRYYVPTLQQRETLWRRMLPDLKRNSESRISNNKEYRDYLDRALMDDEEPPNKDVQMDEAVNIVKDMIRLTPHSGAEKPTTAKN